VLWGAADGAGPEGTVLKRTGPESTVPSAASAISGAGLRPAGADCGQCARSVPAATASTTTTASGRHRSAVTRLLGGAVSREHGELLADVRGVAVGAADRFPVPDELLEMRLALHADVLVDRHRCGSLGRDPDGWRAERALDCKLPGIRYGTGAFLLKNVRIVGSGRVGSAVAGRLRERGFVLRDDEAELVLLCVPDRAISEVAQSIPAGPWIAHVSGATPLAALEPHERRFGLHPLQSFTRARGPEQLDGAYAAVTAETDEARQVGFWIARELGLDPFELLDAERALYHAGAAVASNFLVTLHRAAADLVEAAGAPPEALVPLMRRVIENDFELTGPIERGDWETVEAHVAAIRERRPQVEPLYRALADATAALPVP
jgi:hypothetical protein